ncbi:hypothetical protein HMPREF0731_2697, partial [Pseudoroseomonas cervicalis ATCC 49957]
MGASWFTAPRSSRGCRIPGRRGRSAPAAPPTGRRAAGRGPRGSGPAPPRPG